MEWRTPIIGLALATTLAASGCTHSIHQVHVSGFEPYAPKSKGRMISASAKQKVFLGFADNTAYVNRAYARLQKRCRGGRIQGITTQYSTSHGFFSWTNKILMKGLCLK